MQDSMVLAKFGVGSWLVMAQLLWLSACGGHSMTHSSAAGSGGTAESHAGSSGAESHAGSSGTESHAGSGGSCSSDLPDAEQLATTPRANTNLELLALKFSKGVVAEQEIYDRLVRDVALITAQNNSISEIAYFPPHDGKELLLIADARAFGEMQAGTYRAWDCLNDSYGVEAVSTNPGTLAFALLTLEGIYNLDLVSKQYAALPGIKSADPNIGGGDGPTICVVREDSQWHYVFDRAGGDCPAGCTEHEYTHFTVTTAGVVADLGRPSVAETALYASREACR